MFTQAVIENLKYYVYYLQDPRDENIFYIGKGVGNRVFAHMESAIDTLDDSDKLDTIRDIIKSGNKVRHFILRHGLTEEDAFEVEAALIDFVGMSNLSNLQGGHYSSDFGIKTADEIIAMYKAETLSTTEPCMLININRLYDKKMTDLDLYEATRKSWVVGVRREKVKYAIATYRGLTREIYKVYDWYPSILNGKNRWVFNGVVADESIRSALRYKSIKSIIKKGASNPIKYLNC